MKVKYSISVYLVLYAKLFVSRDMTGYIFKLCRIFKSTHFIGTYQYFHREWGWRGQPNNPNPPKFDGRLSHRVGIEIYQKKLHVNFNAHPGNFQHKIVTHKWKIRPNFLKIVQFPRVITPLTPLRENIDRCIICSGLSADHKGTKGRFTCLTRRDID